MTKITYIDKEGKFRTTCAKNVKEIAGCLKFMAVSPDGNTRRIVRPKEMIKEVKDEN